jgi:8-hydroxy-5-deazaflavin:NADPH oxidoreductase
MKISVFGTGVVGQTLAGRLHTLGHQVIVGTRNVDNTMSRNTKDAYGSPTFSEWYRNYNDVKVATYADAAAFAEIVINATNGSASLSALKMAGVAALNTKVLVDVTNPLDSSKGMPPVLIPSLCNTTSLGEEIQRSFPKLNVVKALNTMWCGLMINPSLIGDGNHNVFLCGNEVSAKSTVVQLLTEFGWKREKIIDLGDISASRGMEMILPLWLRVMMTRGNGTFNFNVVA